MSDMKYLEMEDITPKWSNHIRVNGLKQKTGIFSSHKLNMTDYSYCIIGEAHGFNQKYANAYDNNWCSDCQTLAKRFDRAFKRKDILKFATLKTKFETHWNDVHVPAPIEEPPKPKRKTTPKKKTKPRRR